MAQLAQSLMALSRGKPAPTLTQGVGLDVGAGLPRDRALSGNG
ncbi:hypothetical protein AWT69_001327 [Pseudomonas putida]|nr:hypothetical protein AWT69_001327 [Pseudomonas putida]